MSKDQLSFQLPLEAEEMRINGARYLPGFLSPELQATLISHLHKILEMAPLFRPTMPRTGKPFSVQMSNCGSLGWVSDKARGYRYQDTHPDTGKNWPAMPSELLECWQRLTDFPGEPEACLINFYNESARMGLHRDEDEVDLSAPVVSLSLGDTAKFRIGGLSRSGSTRSFELKSGDALVLEGDARLAYHGIDKIIPGSSSLAGTKSQAWGKFHPFRRINLTLRRVK